MSLRSYGQHDPIVEYRIEGFNMFDEMVASIREDTVHMLLTIEVRQPGVQPQRQQVAQPTGEGAPARAGAKGSAPIRVTKIGRNDPCPCGSGLKWKKCTCKEVSIDIRIGPDKHTNSGAVGGFGAAAAPLCFGGISGQVQNAGVLSDAPGKERGNGKEYGGISLCAAADGAGFVRLPVFGAGLRAAAAGRLRLPWALLISGIVYAGSMQFVLVGLLGGGFASLASVALTTLSVNSRHLFYGLSFLDTFRQMGRAKPYMIFSLSDETYSLQCSVQIPEQLNANRTRLWISALDQGYWVAGSVAGAALGSVLPFDLTGIDFAMTALFVVIFVDQWRAAKSHLPAVAGLVFGLVWLLVLGPDRFLLPALVCTVLALAACRGRLDADTAGRKEVRR